MRKNLYRGFHKCKDGDTVITLDGEKIRGTWVEGYYVKSVKEIGLLSKPTIIIAHQIWYDKNNQQVYLEVLLETVCEYTSLTDKNGKKIFEGDIVEWAGIKMLICWGEVIGAGYGFYWQNVNGNNYYSESITGFIDEYEVIGNKWENPELLEN